MENNRSLYILFDTVAKEGGNVFTAKNNDVAKRQVRNTFKENTFMNPKEYVLFKVADYSNVELSLQVVKEVIDFMEV